MNPPSKSIWAFKNGDVVTRVKPAILESMFGPFKDSSFMGVKYIFLGIANGCIYLERTSQVEKVFQGQTFFLPLEFYETGWNYYEEPEFLKGKHSLINFFEKTMNKQSLESLRVAHEKALQSENYELAAQLQIKIDSLKKEIDENPISDTEGPGLFFNFGNLEDLMGPEGDDLDDPDDIK